MFEQESFCKDCQRVVTAKASIEVDADESWMWVCTTCDRWIKRLTDDEVSNVE